MRNENQILLQTKDLRKYFTGKKGLFNMNPPVVKAVDDINLTIHKGETLGLVGESGCGKSTLGRTILNLIPKTSGQIFYEGQDIEKEGLSNHRKKNVAFIFQSYNLIDYLTPKENVALTCKLPPGPVLEKVGLTEEESKRNVLKLSGGQQPRVAIASASAADARQDPSICRHSACNSYMLFMPTR